MKNKKVLLLLFLMMFLCGCNADVTLEVSENEVTEQINITALVDHYNTKETLKGTFRKYVPIYNDVIVADTEPDTSLSGVKYYDQSSKELDNGYLFSYKNTFSISNYNKARSLKSSFVSAYIEKDRKENTLTLFTDKNGIIYLKDYDNLDSVTIKVKTKLKVLENNADEIDNGVYYWTFTQNDNKKNIYLKLSTKKDVSKKDTEVKKDTSRKSNEEENKIDKKYAILIALGAIVLFLIVVVIITKVSSLKYK